MNKSIRVLAIDHKVQRIEKITKYMANNEPNIKIDFPSDLKTLIQLIEVSNYDCIITPSEISVLNKTELMYKLIDVIKLPIIDYNSDYFLDASECNQSDLVTTLPSNDESRLYSILVNRIKNCVKPPNCNGIINFLQLPEFPKVNIKGNELFIVNENGFEEYWGDEPENEIKSIALQMELELKAIKWIRQQLERFISELSEILMYAEFSEDTVSNLIYEGYRNVLISFYKLVESKRLH